MAAELQVKQQQTVPAMGITGKVQGEKGAAQSQSGPNCDAAETQVLLTILQEYEKTKAAIMGALVKNSNNTQQDLKGSALGQALGNNPLWQAASSNSGVSQVSYTPADMQNFFFLIFKFLRDHSDGDAKMQVTQAMNMVAQEGMLDSITQESTSSLTHMEYEVHRADKKAHSPLAMFLKIGLPLILAFVTVLVSVVSFGAAAPAAVAADAVGTGVLEGVELGVEAGVAAGVTEGLGNAAVEVTADEVGTVGEEATANVATKAASLVTKETLQTAIKEAIVTGIANAGKGATQAAIQTAVKAAVQEAVQEVVQQAVAQAVEEGCDAVATTSISAAMDAGAPTISTINAAVVNQVVSDVSDSVMPTVLDSAGESVEETTAKTVLQRILIACTAKSIGVATALTAAMAGIDTAIGQTCMNQPETEAAQDINNATSLEQGTMAVNSAASDGVQNDLKQGMQYQQNEQSEQQSDQSMLQQTIQSMTKVFYIGSY